MGDNPGLSDLVPGPENPLFISAEPFVAVLHIKITATSLHIASSARCEDDGSYFARQGAPILLCGLFYSEILGSGLEYFGGDAESAVLAAEKKNIFTYRAYRVKREV